MIINFYFTRPLLIIILEVVIYDQDSSDDTEWLDLRNCFSVFSLFLCFSFLSLKFTVYTVHRTPIYLSDSGVEPCHVIRAILVINHNLECDY